MKIPLIIFRLFDILVCSKERERGTHTPIKVLLHMPIIIIHSHTFNLEKFLFRQQSNLALCTRLSFIAKVVVTFFILSRDSLHFVSFCAINIIFIQHYSFFGRGQSKQLSGEAKLLYDHKALLPSSIPRSPSCVP